MASHSQATTSARPRPPRCLDTSVLGAVCDPSPEDRLAATRRILDGLRRGLWDGYISALVLEEVSRAHGSVRRRIASVLDGSPVAVLDESNESVALAQAYLAAGAVPPDYEDDARHVAIATVSDMNAIVSPWEVGHEET